MRLSVFSNYPISQCYGCRACLNVCPQKAIDFVENAEGFAYPKINVLRCIDCGICESVCPTQDGNLNKILCSESQTCYAAWNNNLEERLKSSSGGIFYVLAFNEIVLKHGVVYGVAFDSDFRAKHIRVSRVEDLDKLRGSKYLQSDTGISFKQVKNDLDGGSHVLYSGTPCQIAGLKLYLRKNYDNLLTVDLVCAGVPSPKFFHQHIDYIENKYQKTLKDYKFRYKKHSGWRSYVQYIFADDTTKENTVGNDPYMYFMYGSYIFRESCYACKFSRLERPGDITLSDFWGVEYKIKILKKIRKYGFNMILCNSDKGRDVIESCRQISKIEVPINYAEQSDVRLRNTIIEPLLRRSIYQDFIDNGYCYVVKKYYRKPSLLHRLIPISVKNIIKEIESKFS